MTLCITMKLPAPYSIIKSLGQGATAEVYEIRDENTGESLALKVFHAHIVNNADFAARGRKEFEIASKLVHPNIVEVRTIINDPPAVVMKLVDGETLESLQGRLPFVFPELALYFVRPVLKALMYAHEQKVVHRDLKPSNILVSKEGEVLLSDFGLAHVEDSTRLTLTGTILGSPDYMSCEQARGDWVGPPSDLFSLSSILYFLVTGTCPFRRARPLATLAAVVACEFEAPEKRNPKLSPRITALIKKGLNREIENRYKSACEFLNSIDSYLLSVGLNPERDLVKEWMRAPSQVVMSELRGLAHHLEQQTRDLIGSKKQDAAVEKLSHLALVAPESEALSMLSAHLGSTRTEKRKVIPYWRLSAAAVLLFAILGTVFYASKPDMSSPQLSPLSPTDARESKRSLLESAALTKPQTVVAEAKLESKTKTADRVQATTTVRFDVEPGVRVFWNGIERYPDEVIKNVSAGSYLLRMQKSGRAPIIQRVRVDGSEPITIRAR